MPQLTWYVPIEQWGKRTYFHFQIPDTWQWLVASATQLATLLPTELAIGVCRTPLWRKLAASVTTSLYTKATALANFPTPITAIWTTSISSRTDGQELKPLVITLHYFASTTMLLLAAWGCEGINTLAIWDFLKDGAKSQESSEKAKKGCSIAFFHNFKAQASHSLPMILLFFCNNFF